MSKVCELSEAGVSFHVVLNTVMGGVKAHTLDADNTHHPDVDTFLFSFMTQGHRYSLNNRAGKKSCGIYTRKLNSLATRY